MIDLKIDISYLSRYFGISTARSLGVPFVNEDDENINIDTQDGAITLNAEMLQKLLQDPRKLAIIMKLEDPENRYLIIQQFNEQDLIKLLPFLSSKELSFGLQYFTMDGLGELMNMLPGEQMVNLLLEHFTMEDVVPFMETTEMDEFLGGTELQKKDVMEYLKGMDFEKIQALMVNQFGYEFNDKSHDEYLKHIEGMEDGDYKGFLAHLQNPEKMEMIAGLCNIEPDYYLQFDNSILARPMFNKMEKEDIIKTMQKLDPEFLIPMIEELPEDLIQVVATQIDPTVFSSMLSSEFPEMLMQMLAG